MNRRTFLTLGAAGIGFLAGCPSDSQTDPQTASETTIRTPTPPMAATATPTRTPTENRQQFRLKETDYPREVEASEDFNIDLRIRNIGDEINDIEVSVLGRDADSWFHFEKTVSREIAAGESQKVSMGPISINIATRVEFQVSPFGKAFTVSANPASNPFFISGAHPIPYYSKRNGPNAYHFAGSTYVSFQGSGANRHDPMVVAYDHNEASLRGPYKIGDNPLAPANDSHGIPALIVDDDGFIHVVYGGHARWNDGHQRHAISANPGVISEWEHLDNIPSATTYPQLVKLSDGTIYLFQRGPSQHWSGHAADWTYQRSSDGGRSFSDPRPFLAGFGDSGEIHTNGLYGDEWGDSWYLFIQRGPNSELPIAITGNYHACGHTGSWETKDERLIKEQAWWSRYNQYLLFMDASGHFISVDGTDLTSKLPIDKPTADEHLMVIDTGTKSCMEGANIDYTSSDRPHLAFALGNQGDEDRPGKYAKWKGSRWSLIDAPRGIPEVREDSLILRSAGRSFGISKDEGESWEFSRVSEVPFQGLRRVRNAHPEARFTVSEKPEIDWSVKPGNRDIPESGFLLGLYGDSGFLNG